MLESVKKFNKIINSSTPIKSMRVEEFLDLPLEKVFVVISEGWKFFLMENFLFHQKPDKRFYCYPVTKKE